MIQQDKVKSGYDIELLFRKNILRMIFLLRWKNLEVAFNF